MKFIADVNITQTVITSLRQNKHEVLDLKKVNLQMPDTEIISMAQEENWIILTHDKDFEDLIQHSKYHVGIILIRLKDQHSKHHFEKLNEVLKNQREETLQGSLTVIEEDKVHILPY